MSNKNPILRDISDANFYPQAPRFHSSLKSYGEMVITKDAAAPLPAIKRSISPAPPSAMKSKFCFSPKGEPYSITAAGTPYAFNELNRVKQSIKRNSQLMN